MKIFIRLFFAMFLLLQSCATDQECEDLSCTTPPVSFIFELVDSATGENLFTNGTYTPSQIEINNLNDDDNIAYTFIDENEVNLIQIASIGWESGVTNIALELDSERMVTLYVDAERVTDDCCNFTRYNEVRIETEFGLDEQDGVYRILVD
ncbi:hypothetical protein [Salinimicrobium sp. GXAS 041]|uniref:hypothetical protein n=1 Tax=Salinimicrobium sp. GXAS 041 TaxID=3400806 RepID=UPI003C76C9B9